MRRIMAVYDEDPFYAARFADVANRKEKIPFDVVAFSSPEKLRQFAGKHPIELLLLGDRADKEEVAGAAKQIILTGIERNPEEKGYPCVYKYQSADAILREIMVLYGDQPDALLQTYAGPGARIIGVFSPVGRCRKTSFAIVLGKLLSREEKTLYLSMETCSGLSFLTGEEYRQGLSDLLYYWKTGKYNRLRLSGAVYSMGELDYIPPVRWPEDLEEAGPGTAAELIGGIAKDSGYATMIVDAGNFCRGVIPVLKRCCVIYMPVKEDGVSGGKLKEFEVYLEETGNREIMDKIRKLKLPDSELSAGAGNYMEQLLWGELGDFVRQLLRGGAGEQGGGV